MLVHTQNLMTSPSLIVGSGGSKRGAFWAFAPANKAKPAKISRQLAITLRNFSEFRVPFLISLAPSKFSSYVLYRLRGSPGVADLNTDWIFLSAKAALQLLRFKMRQLFISASAWRILRWDKHFKNHCLRSSMRVKELMVNDRVI